MAGFFESIGNFFMGSPGKHKKVSKLRPGQEGLADQLVNAGMNPGAGGAFGDTADYYRNLMSDDSADYQAFAAPQMRQFNEEIIPQLSEQFSGYGGIGSSGFRNAAVNAGTDLSERLGSIRAQLRQQGAQGLQNIGQAGLQQFDENIYQPGTPGLLDYASNALGNFGTQALGNYAQNWFSNPMNKGSQVGQNRNPYTNQPGANKNFQLPNFNQNMR